MDTSADFDSPWKEILEGYFPQFVEFFFPRAAADIDWKRGHEFLDKELQQITLDAETGTRYVDKLVKVWPGDGDEKWVLIHVEIQGQRDGGFAERMYIYNNRIYDRYRRQVASFAVLTDASKNWRPNRFAYELWGCRIALEFPSVKLIDLHERAEELQRSTNAFAVVVLAHLRTMASRGDAQQRLAWKLELVRQLFRRGYERQQVVDLLRFIDWVMTLPEALADEFWNTMQNFEEVRQMPYITSIERIGIRKGLEQGLQQGLQQGLHESILEILLLRFAPLPESTQGRIEAVTDTQILRELLRTAASAESLDEFLARLGDSDA